MAGRDGARGYVYQALVAVFKCFQYDSWNQIKVERKRQIIRRYL